MIKKLLTLLLVSFCYTFALCNVVLADVTIDSTNFPDTNFREYIASTAASIDKNQDGVLSDSELSEQFAMSLGSRNIASLQGIEYFTALRYLDCRNNQLTTLDLSSNTALIAIDCYSNQLTDLNIGNNTALTNLNCYDNQVTTLNLRNVTALVNLICNNNQITSLDVSNNTLLKNLTCNNNQLTALNIGSNNVLTDIYCGDNQLTELDVSNAPALVNLVCFSNDLTALNLTNNTELEVLSCEFNELTTLDLSNNALLKEIWLGNNKLTALDVSNNTALETLDCYNNQLKTLDVSANNDMTSLYYGNNYLQKLDLSSNTNLSSVIDAYYISTDQSVTEFEIISSDNVEYPYEFDFSVLSIDASEFTSRITSIDARNASNDVITYTTASPVVELVSLPATISYYYDTQATSASVDKYMKVNVSSFDVSIVIRKISPDVTITSPATKIVTLSSDGGSFDNVIVSVSGDYDSYGLEYSSDISATITSSSDVWIVSGAVPANLTSYDISYDIAVIFSRDKFLGSDNFTVVVEPATSYEEEPTTTSSDILSVSIISPDTKIITLSSDAGSFDNVIVSVSGDYDDHSISAPSGVSADMTQSGDVWVVWGLVPENSTSFDVSYDIAIEFSQSSASISSHDILTVIIVGAIPTVIEEDEEDDSDEESDVVTGGESVTSRAWRYNFSMPSGLQSALMSKFGLSDSSSIRQFNDSEIINEDWTIGDNDASAITNLGESVIINIPTVRPSNSGVYVMRYSLSGATPGSALSFHGVSGAEVSTSELQNDISYVFYDEDFNEVTTVPENGIVYIAMNLEAGNTRRGVITTAFSRVTITTVISDDELINNIVANVSALTTSADVKFITEDQIMDIIGVPSQELKEEVSSDDNEIIGNLGTVSVDVNGYYILKITLSDDLYEQVKDVPVEDLKVYFMTLDEVVQSKFNVSFVGLLNAAELLTLKGEKLKFGTREFLLGGFLNAGQPVTLFLAKAILSIFTGGAAAGCNGGIGLCGLILLILFKISSRK